MPQPPHNDATASMSTTFGDQQERAHLLQTEQCHHAFLVHVRRVLTGHRPQATDHYFTITIRLDAA